MKPFSLSAVSIAKEYEGRPVFSGMKLDVSTGDSLAVTGKNGSGKTTLIKILAGIMPPSSGSIEFRYGRDVIEAETASRLSGFTAPYMNLYDDLDGMENLCFASATGRIGPETEELASRFGLTGQLGKRVGHYSSGMKQRLKFMAAVMNDPPALFLDEPETNLDADGKKAVFSYIKSVSKRMLIVIATNDIHAKRLCRRSILLGG